MKILITGVAGFLGSRFARWVLKNHPSVEVFGVDDLSCGYRENVPNGVQWICSDLVRHGLQGFQDTDYVFHFAAYAAEGLSPFIRRYNYTNNLLATAEVVNFCINRGVKRLVFTSSMAVYGNGEVVPFSESAPCRPIDPYGIAKLACEQDIECAGTQHGLDWCIIRPHNLYGPGQSIWQKYRNVLGHWMSMALQGETPLVYGDGSQLRAFSWIDDCLPCLWEAAVNQHASNRIINLGGSKPVTIHEAANIVSGVTGARWERAPVRHEVKYAWCTTHKSEQILGYRETVPLSEGIERMWHWAQDAWGKYPERRGKHQVAPIEVENGLYPYWREGDA